ncbi:MAG: hypothetical protein U0792_06705 [Gemmataceae bacterium]
MFADPIWVAYLLANVGFPDPVQFFGSMAKLGAFWLVVALAATGLALQDDCKVAGITG